MSSSAETITRLPDYFPTSCKQCTQATQDFFQCFEKNAFMKDERDTVTAKHSLEFCQSELRAYMTCMEANMNKKPRSWWKLW